MQARPAALFVQEANRFSIRCFFIEKKDGKKVNAKKSIMGLMSLAVSANTTITIVTEGSDEVEALDALVKYVKRRIGQSVGVD
ncbi:HPr family phosphocarrier protein [Ectobacillus funiculus]